MRLQSPRSSQLLLILGFLCAACVSGNLQAGSATWSATPQSGNWYTATNWVPQTVPNGPDDIATFAASSVTDITLPASSITVLDSIILQAGTISYTLTVRDKSSLTFAGGGAPDLSGIFLTVEAGGSMTFKGSSQCHAGIFDSGKCSFKMTPVAR